MNPQIAVVQISVSGIPNSKVSEVEINYHFFVAINVLIINAT